MVNRLGWRNGGREGVREEGRDGRRRKKEGWETMQIQYMYFRIELKEIVLYKNSYYHMINNRVHTRRTGTVY